MKQESQFGMSQKKIEELRTKQKEEQQEAEGGKGISLPEASSLVAKNLEEGKEPFSPSLEVLDILEEEGDFLPQKQSKLFKVFAFLLEQMIGLTLKMLKTGQMVLFEGEEKSAMEKMLGDLEIKYENIFGPHTNEFNIAHEVLEGVEEYFETIQGKKQPLSVVWSNILSRLEAFHINMIVKDVRSEEEKARTMMLLARIKFLIGLRLPNIFDFVPLEGKKSGPRRETATRESIEGFLQEKHWIPLSEEFVKQANRELAHMVEQYGETNPPFVNPGLDQKTLFLEVGNSMVGIVSWGKGESVHMQENFTKELAFIALDQNGKAWTAVNTLDDQETRQQWEKTKQREEKEWVEFISSVLEAARKLPETKIEF